MWKLIYAILIQVLIMFFEIQKIEKEDEINNAYHSKDFKMTLAEYRSYKKIIEFIF